MRKGCNESIQIESHYAFKYPISSPMSMHSPT